MTINLRWKLLIFDLDGTLLDSMPQHASAFASLLREHLPYEKAYAHYRMTAGRPLPWQFQSALSTLEQPHVSDIDTLVTDFFDRVERVAPSPFPDVDSGIRQFASLGCTLVVSTNLATPIARYRLQKAQLLGCFRLVLGSEGADGHFSKGPAHFSMIRRELGLATSEFSSSTAFVGDAEYDMEVAAEAGITPVGRLTNRNRHDGDRLIAAGATILIDKLDQLSARLVRDL